ncbi:MAG: DUF5131 family protein [Opitutaceae bacterium]
MPDSPSTSAASRLVFASSMSVLFHEKRPLIFIQKNFTTTRACPQHTFQILNKTRKLRLPS